MSVPLMKVGSYTGNATAATKIDVGFRPNFIWAWNSTDNDTAWIWVDDDTSNVATIVLAWGTNASAITVSDHGFVLPGDAIVNENLKVYRYLAVKADS